jgi:hypothetical protein
MHSTAGSWVPRESRSNFAIHGDRMSPLYKGLDDPKYVFGNLVVVGFLLMQCLDGVFTYLAVGIWGPGIEANPLISSTMELTGVGASVAGAKLVAIAFGMLLHLQRVHKVVALLTAIYFAAAILPWTVLFLTN